METLATLSKEQAYQTFAGPSRDMIGKRFRIDHLTSERGRTMNGKICSVVSFAASYQKNPGIRVGCKIQEEDGSESPPISFKVCNLVRLEGNIMQNLMQASSPLPDKEIIKGLRRALAGQESTDTDRADLTHRINLYRNVFCGSPT